LAPELTDFAAETRRLMAVRGYSQRRLALAAGIDPGDLSKMLNGIKAPTPANMARMDDVLSAGGSIRDSEAPRPALACSGVPRRRLGAADADAVLAALASFRNIDNRSGGAHAHALAAAYLDTAVTPMLRYGSYTEVDGRFLFSAAAQLAALAAWTAYDNGDGKKSEHYFARSLELAAAAGDGAFTGEVLAARSHRAIHLGRPGRAVELARAARHAASDAGVPALLAEAHELEANGHALTGDRAECARSLAACEREFARATPDSTPPWLAYFDAAYLAARTAHTLRDAGDWQAAIEHGTEADRMSDGMARARVFNRLIVATAHVQGDRDAAIGDGRQALGMTAGIQSGRAASYARDLRKRLRRRYGSGDPQVAAFDEEARKLLGS
jgi:transcriptional regulator with XRE-family HTH domain